MHATQHAIDAAVAAANGGVTFNTGAIIGWLQNNAIKLLLAFIALGMLARAKRAKFAENTTILGNVLLALGVFVGGTLFVALANQFVKLASS
jgi:hypothetical protein